MIHRVFFLFFFIVNTLFIRISPEIEMENTPHIFHTPHSAFSTEPLDLSYMNGIRISLVKRHFLTVISRPQLIIERKPKLFYWIW